LLAHAPTGLGKSVAGLVPALAWLAEGLDRRRLFYLVNRVTQHDNPLRELHGGLAHLFRHRAGRPLHVVDLVGRQHLCLHPAARPLEPVCRQSIDEADFALLPSTVASWRQAREHLAGRLCPYHTLQGLMGVADVVVCDYWWLFSQAAAGGDLDDRLGPQREWAAVIDEAHNLPLRIRGDLDVDETPAALAEQAARAPRGIQGCLTPVIESLLASDPGEGASPSALLPLAGGAGALESALAAVAEVDDPDAALSPPVRLLRLLLRPDEDVVLHAVPAGADEPEPRVLARLVDPTRELRAGYGKLAASLSMSGTLAAPSDGGDELAYSLPLFGLSPGQAAARRYASPFPPLHQRWVYCPDTYGTFRRRREHLGRYAHHVARAGRATPGVTAVFFSSYSFLEQVRSALGPAEGRLVVAEERRHAENPDAAGDLEAYRERLGRLVAEKGRAYLFAVYQGKIAEGADFPDNLLKTVVCVSLPLERPRLFHARLRDRYVRLFEPVAAGRGDSAQEKAREYALDRLSLSLVLQACGRGIRREADRCVFVLLDERYGEGKDGFDWRRFLEPRPYNVFDPAASVRLFHEPPAAAPEGGWDAALLRAWPREGT
jgi:Rad3-related DNA helicase